MARVKMTAPAEAVQETSAINQSIDLEKGKLTHDETQPGSPDFDPGMFLREDVGSQEKFQKQDINKIRHIC